MGVSSLVALGALLATVFLWQRKSKKSLGALPPGPKPVPLLGNILDLTAKELWLPAMKWAKEFGECSYKSLRPCCAGALRFLSPNMSERSRTTERKGRMCCTALVYFSGLDSIEILIVFEGSVTYLHVLGQGLVFLNTSEAAFDLLERKGATYSDKPYLVMVCEL